MLPEIWLPHFNQLSPAYEIFSWLPSDFLAKENWPELEEYNLLATLLNHPLINDQKITLRFVPQSSKSEKYEPRIYLQGEVQTRIQNWHDFFNMLIWHTFPTIKAKLNKLQYFSLLQRDEFKQRSKLENFLTLFDENGLITVSSNPNLFYLIESMQWKEFFWYQRDTLNTQLKTFLFGHSLHEKLLSPYIGMVGHSLLLLVDETFFAKTLPQQIKEIQIRICNLNFDEMTTKNLFPIPILGFPGWWSESNCASFYDNQNYFRSKRQK